MICSEYLCVPDFAALLQPDQGQTARLITFVAKAGFEEWLANQPDRVRMLAKASKFAAKPGEFLVIPSDTNDDWSAVLGAGEHGGFWDLAVAAGRLPEGTYRLAGEQEESALLGWLVAHYRFASYLQKPEATPERILLTSHP
jgi:leucyl aminopeptidase